MEYKNVNSIILLESPWYYVPLYLWKLTINEKWPFWNTCIKIPLYPSCWRSENLVSHLSDSFIFSCLLQGLQCHYCQQNRWNPRGRCRNRMWSLLHWEVRRWVSCNLKAFQNYDISVHQTKVVSAIVVKVDKCDMYWK